MGASVSQQVIIRKTNVDPIGSKNGVNLVFEAPDVFDPGSLEVYLSGLFLDRDEDFEVKSDNKTVEIKVDPTNPVRLNCPPQQFEPLKFNYVLC